MTTAPFPFPVARVLEALVFTVDDLGMRPGAARCLAQVLVIDMDRKIAAINRKPVIQEYDHNILWDIFFKSAKCICTIRAYKLDKQHTRVVYMIDFIIVVTRICVRISFRINIFD